MIVDPDTLEGQDIPSTAESLFGDAPDGDVADMTTPLVDTATNIDTVVEPAVVAPVTPVVPVTPVAPVIAAKPTPVAPTLPSTGLTPEQIAKITPISLTPVPIVPVAPVAPVTPVAPVQQQAAPIQQSQADVDRMLNRFTLDEKGYDAIFETTDKAESIKALNVVLQGVARQAVTMAHHLIQDSQHQITQQVQPYMQFADTQREGMLRGTFFQSHPDLVGADPIITAVMTQMKAANMSFKSEKELFEAVATSTKAQLTQLGVIGQPVTQTPAANGRRKAPMAALPTGGQGGNTQSASGDGGQSTARNIFG